MKKILVALSGGVDSACACLLLRQQGYEVGGATMLLRDGGEQEAADAREAARQMGLEFFLFDLRQEFRERVIEPFARVYQSGGTPNPCVVCNRTMKFGLFLEKALELGYDGMATGHYARILYENGRYIPCSARDRAKDQTYMLCSLSQAQLAHTLFPLGEAADKESVRKEALAAGLSLARKHDSQDICFVPDGDYMAYLTAKWPEASTGQFYHRRRHCPRAPQGYGGIYHRTAAGSGDCSGGANLCFGQAGNRCSPRVGRSALFPACLCRRGELFPL